MRPGRAPWWLALAIAASCTSTPAHRPAPAASKGTPAITSTGRLDVHVTGLASLEGRVIVSLHDEHTYLNDDAFVAKATEKVTAAEMHVALERVPAGRYLVVVTHDQNGNDTLDTNVLGLPTEAYGFSRDARGSFGPPSFDDAAFDFDGKFGQIVVSLR